MGLKLLAIFALLDLAVVAVSTAEPGRGAKPSVSDEVMANRTVKRQAKRGRQRKKKLKDEPAPMWETSSYMLQYGPPRSATTLQFMTMCASSCLKHGPATACLFVSSVLSETSKICTHWKDGESPPLVCKSHSLKLPVRKRAGLTTANVKVTDSSNKFIFVTGTAKDASEESTAVARRMEREHDLERNAISYAALTNNLGKPEDPLLLADYARVLDLSDGQVATLKDYLDAWDKLRVCCGAQMSVDYRDRLVGKKTRKKRRFKYTGNQTKASDLCETYDLLEVEKKLMSTEVFTTCGHNVKLIRQLSPNDAPFDGSYCHRAFDATKSMGLKFNDKRYRYL